MGGRTLAAAETICRRRLLLHERGQRTQPGDQIGAPLHRPRLGSSELGAGGLDARARGAGLVSGANRCARACVASGWPGWLARAFRAAGAAALRRIDLAGRSALPGGLPSLAARRSAYGDLVAEDPRRRARRVGRCRFSRTCRRDPKVCGAGAKNEVRLGALDSGRAGTPRRRDRRVPCRDGREETLGLHRLSRGRRQDGEGVRGSLQGLARSRRRPGSSAVGGGDMRR
mmetsp:Transcript_86713/g.250432  ORF Transcript_86713/g.250432 Transcript_86713/m.250432 type:complete len:229 (-) Transcript_86713:704-1390(-)